jgi:glycosyltransferase involved in cell wall biosynthesis
MTSEKLSLHMIVRDAEHKLGRTLECVKSFVDEMVIVDTGSTDGTKALAESYGAKVYDFEWINDFSAARNFALSKTTNDWVTWLDAGDVISLKAIQRFETVKAQLGNNDANYIIGILNRYYDEYGNVSVCHLTPRLVKKSAGAQWGMQLHEGIFLTEKPLVYIDYELVVEDPEGQLPSSTDRNLEIIDFYLAKNENIPYFRCLRVRELEILERYEEAVADIDEMMTFPMSKEQRAEYFLCVGRCFIKLGETEKAKEMLLKSIENEPTFRDGHILLGDFELANKQWLLAMKHYRDAVNILPDTHHWVKKLPYWTYEPLEKLGICYRALGDDASAAEYFTMALQAAPDGVIQRMVKDLMNNSQVC